MKRLTFKKQLKKIMTAYHGFDLCAAHPEHAFVTVLLNGHTSWLVGVEIKGPQLDLSDTIADAKSREFTSFSDVLEHARKAANSLHEQQCPESPLFWSKGGQFVAEEEGESTYLAGLVIHNESRGQYTLEEMLEIHNAFMATVVTKSTSEEEAENGLFKGLKAAVKLLAQIHANAGEDVFSYELVQRIVKGN
jgi:hypothetical protein